VPILLIIAGQLQGLGSPSCVARWNVLRDDAQVSCGMLTAIVLSPLAGTITGILALGVQRVWMGRVGPSVVTSEFKINYVRPAMGEYIVARATVIHAEKNQAVCRCDVYVSSNHNESLCATSRKVQSLGLASPQNREPSSTSEIKKREQGPQCIPPRHSSFPGFESQGLWAL
jgi:uncharacterized protein (TIGR00369 family)